MVSGLYYRQLAAVLRELGFKEEAGDKGRNFLHPSGASLRLPVMSDDEPVRAYHLVAARAAADDFGVISREGFDRMISKAADRPLSISAVC